MAGGIAVDVGGTKILVAAVDGDDAVVRVPTRLDAGAEGIVDQIVRTVERIAVADDGGPVVVASPGELDTAAGVVRYAANLPFRGFPLAAALSERLGKPVTLMGDATAAAVAEFSSGAAGSSDHGAYVTVSTGIGMGLVVDGKLITGVDGHAGELGHVSVRPHADVRCRCGQRGCLEAYASGRGLADRAREALEREPDTILRHLPEARVTARDVIAAWREDDGLATRLVTQAIDLLATAIAAVVRVLAPEVVVLGGGLLLSGGLVEPVRERVAQLLSPNDGDVRARLRPAGYGEYSALRGAAAICRGDTVALRLTGAVHA
jgi:predicted NBD/HSP70 family sugar kinase